MSYFLKSIFLQVYWAIALLKNPRAQKYEYEAGVAASLVNIIEFFSRSQSDIKTSWSTSAAAARRSRAHHQFLVQVKVPASTCRQGSIAQVGYPVPNPFAR